MVKTGLPVARAVNDKDLTFGNLRIKTVVPTESNKKLTLTIKALEKAVAEKTFARVVRNKDNEENE
jgi:hypothetical protein